MTTNFSFKHCSALPASTSTLNLITLDEVGRRCVLFCSWQCCVYPRMHGHPQRVMNSRSSQNGLEKTFVHWELTASTQSLKSRYVTFSKLRRECLTTIFRLNQRKRSGYASQANSLHTLRLYAPVNWRTTEGDKEVLYFMTCAIGVHESASQTDDPIVVAPPLLVMHSAHPLLH